MFDADSAAAVTIRPAASEDAEGIARAFIESADYHASLDPERYSTPAAEKILARYRDGRQHSRNAAEANTTLVAEFAGQIVGFVEARLEQSADVMHRQMIYCHIVELAVVGTHQRQGIGRRLMQAAESWGVEHGAEFASLEYHAANIRARTFYQDRGYRTAAVTAIRRLSSKSRSAVRP